jgi:hypothetical protein
MSGARPPVGPVVVGQPGQSVYHRLESPTQTPAVARQQVQSMEIWGLPARGSPFPSVKAYRNNLPSQQTRGIEFSSNVAPTKGVGTPYEARWYVGTAGVFQRPNNHVGVPIFYIKNTQVP